MIVAVVSGVWGGGSNMRSKRKLIIFTLLALAGAIVLYVVVVLAIFLSADRIDHIPFESAKWKQTSAEWSLESVRLRMATDFLESSSTTKTRPSSERECPRK